jgi:zinc transport system permease protein
MLGAGLSHAAFGGIALALVFGLEPMTFTVFYTVALGLFLQFLIDKKSIPADTLVSLFFSFGVALAIVILGVSQNLGTNLYSYLFGSMLTVTEEELYLSIAVSSLTVGFVFLNFKSLMLLCFNEELARLRGVKVNLLNYLLVAIASANIVLSIKVVGLVLSASFISIPPMTSLFLSWSFTSSLMLSLFFSLLALVVGIILSLYADLPPGGAVVGLMVLLFLLSALVKLIGRRFLRLF